MYAWYISALDSPESNLSRLVGMVPSVVTCPEQPQTSIETSATWYAEPPLCSSRGYKSWPRRCSSAWRTLYRRRLISQTQDAGANCGIRPIAYATAVDGPLSAQRGSIPLLAIAVVVSGGQNESNYVLSNRCWSSAAFDAGHTSGFPWFGRRVRRQSKPRTT
jgi:hypothetical protein